MSGRRGVPGKGQMVLDVGEEPQSEPSTAIPSERPRGMSKKQWESKTYVKQVKIGRICYSLDPKKWTIWFFWDVLGTAVWARTKEEATDSVLAAKEVSPEQAVRWDPSWPLPKVAFKWDSKAGQRVGFTPRILARAVNRVHPLP